MSYDSKYTGSSVEELLEKINDGGGVIIDATSADLSSSGTISQELYDQLYNAALSKKFIYIKQKSLMGSSSPCIAPISYLLIGDIISFSFTEIYYSAIVSIVQVYIKKNLTYTSVSKTLSALTTLSDTDSKEIKIPYSNIQLGDQDSDTIKSIFGKYTTWSSLVSSYENNINPPIVNFYNEDNVLVSSEKPVALSYYNNILYITLMGFINRLLYGYDIVNIQVMYDSDNDSYSCELMHDIIALNN